ncbi:hypothetical protein [Stutzerimonas nitrititolerans]|uniref:hypothetical protein n=1 Tax=Stutzerimonas nitrititolerans TaxID=2482751 RepID=UPI0028981C3A|nr:hypothetical protein [Stutzerimonas nitrititolerans]
MNTNPNTQQAEDLLDHLLAKLDPECDQVEASTVGSASVGIHDAQQLCHFLAKASGWWNDPLTGEPTPRNDGELIALMHSELSEALEGLRKDLMDDKLPHRKAVEVELADTLIRIFDYAGARNLDLAGAMVEKLAYNQQRADHKLENRAQANGKRF